MRIVSLLPSATEILFALGLDHEIVGVSHECDFPPRAKTKPVVIHSRMPHDATPAEIDRLVSEYVHRAGGADVFGRARTPSFRITIEDVVDAAPEILLIAPCGYGAEQAREEYKSMSFPEPWHAIPAVRNGRVYALEANSYFSRPGPRLVTGIEALAKLFHPAVEVTREAESATLPITTSAQTRTASV